MEFLREIRRVFEGGYPFFLGIIGKRPSRRGEK